MRLSTVCVSLMRTHLTIPRDEYTINLQPTDGTQYWIGRNSWGTYWGDYGFFYMAMDSDNLKIESDCLAGTPSATKPKSDDFELFTQ